MPRTTFRRVISAVGLALIGASAGPALVAGPATAASRAAPVVSSVSPTSGPGSGGTSVTITGSGFSGASGVSFGSTPAASFTPVSATQVTATSPPGSGTVDVTVTNKGVTSATGAADRFTYTVTTASPTVSSVSPSGGSTAGGTSVTITGTNLTGATAVSFGTTAAAGFIVNSATQITATSPASSGAATVDVTVTTPGGTSATSSADQFTYTVPPQPTVSGVTPASGPSVGGTAVTVTGTNLTGATGVSFGTTPASAFTVNSPGQISATAPAGSGIVDVTVTTAGGTSATTSADQFTYTSSLPGTIAVVGTLTNHEGKNTTSLAVTPAAVGDLMVLAVKTASSTVTVTRVSGGGVTSWVLLRGPYSGYTGHDLELWMGPVTTAGATTLSVTFSSSVASIYTGLAAQEFTAGSTRAVWAADGTGATTTSSSTTVKYPLLTPSSGNGELYFGYAAVDKTGAGGTTPGFTYPLTTDGDVAAYNPAVQAAVAPTARQNQAANSGSVAALIAATVPPPPPAVTGVSPNIGPTAGGTPVTITGVRFTGATAVAFGTTAAAGFTIVSDTQITTTSPAGAAAGGTVDVTVTGPTGTSTTGAADQFQYVPPPTVTAVSPAAGPTAGGTSVTITGTSFTTGSTVAFGAVAATNVNVLSATQMTATSPAGSPGTVDVTVTAVGGTSATSAADQFTYVPPPTVTSVSPGSGPAAGGTSVTVTGTNLTGTTAVAFGSVAASAFTVNTDTQITVTSPAGSPGTVDVTVSTAGGTSATGLPDQFTWLPPPTVTVLSPSTGPVAGGTPVTITGTNFTGATAVTFGTGAATGFTINSATQITATSPPQSAGTVDVTVTGPGGTSAASSADRFSYMAPVAIGAVGGNTNQTGTGLTTLSVSPHAAGNLLVLSVKISSSTISATSVSGGGASSWTRAEGPYTAYTGHDLELWMGTVASTGPSTITVTYSASVSSINTELTAQELTAGPGAAWALDKAGGRLTSSSTTVGYPSLAAARSGEAYVGYASLSQAAGTGTTSGFVYTVTARGNVATYNTSVAGTVSPTVPQSPSGAAGAVAVLIGATSPVPPALPTVTGVSPGSGLTAGGAAVTITGTNLAGATVVRFGTTATTKFVVVSATQLTVTAPAGSAATVDITVTTPAGTSVTGTADRFSYVVPVVSAVGSMWDTTYDSGGTTLSVGPQAVGDVLVVTVDTHYPFPLSSVSGGGVTTWNKAVQFVSARGHDIELWYGTVATTGSSLITFTWPAPGVSGNWTELTAQEFSSGLGSGTVWSVDNGQAASVDGASSTNVPYPTLTPSLTGDLYYGFAGVPNVPAAGTTPGFTYVITTGTNIICYDPAVNATVSPTASQSPAGQSELVAALLAASPGG